MTSQHSTVEGVEERMGGKGKNDMNIYRPHITHAQTTSTRVKILIEIYIMYGRLIGYSDIQVYIKYKKKLPIKQSAMMNNSRYSQANVST
jgi:hypothetical protein